MLFGEISTDVLRTATGGGANRIMIVPVHNAHARPGWPKEPTVLGYLRARVGAACIKAETERNRL
jgi:hypothetical protein